MNVTLNIGLGVSNLFALALGALIVWALWYRDRKRWAKSAKRLRSAIHNLVFDRRKNSLVGNIVEGIERGKLPAQKDFEILDKVVRAALGVCRAPATSKLWYKEYRKRAFEAWTDDEEEEGPIGEEQMAAFCGSCDSCGPDYVCQLIFNSQTQARCVREGKCVWASVDCQYGTMTADGFREGQ